MSITAPNVVLLEDDAVDADLIQEVLRRQLPDADVRHAATRREYLDLLTTSPVDVVLSDGSVPGCEGIEAFYLARKSDSRVSFIFVSGNDAATDLRGLHALGVSDFLGKDSLEELGPVIRTALSSTETTRDLAVDRKLLAGYEQLVHTVIELSMTRDLPSMMNIVTSAARRLTGADGAAFVLRDGDLSHYADEDAIGPLWKGQKFPVASCISGWAMTQRQPAVVDDIYTDGRMDAAPYLDTFVRSVAVVPIRAADPIGAIGNYWANHHDPDPSEVKLLQALADATAVAMENADIFRNLQARVHERTEELEAFTYAVSHDLRAPIRHMEGFARILMQDADGLPPSVTTNAERIVRAAASMRDMVAGLLSLSRTTRSDVHRQTVDLAELARDVVRKLSADFEHDVDFVAPPSLMVNGDPQLLRRALENLLSNAWKFTSRTLQPLVEIGADMSGEQPVYFVQDNGAGFEPASAERIFGVFQRVHRDDESPGTGVGLASVKRIITKHGGTIRASGSPGRGARFTFTLPDRAVDLGR
jgi:signal transduction histidine kinase/DNA-binding NarL/FixJ family response regulator